MGDDELTRKYGDLLRGEPEAADLRVLRALHSGYAGPGVGYQRRPGPEPRRAGGSSGSRWKGHLRWRRGFVLPTVVLLLAVTVGVALAVRDRTNLGPPTSAVPQNLPTGGFIPMHLDLRRYGFPELLFVGFANDSNSNVERWPLVKALEQFGTLSGATPVDHQCSSFTGPQGPVKACTTPTFDLGRAHFRSRYLVFVYRTFKVSDGRLSVAGLSADERRLVQPYLAAGRYKGPDGTWYSKLNPAATPLVVVGRYVQRGINLVVSTDLMAQASSAPLGLSFAEVQQSLQRGQPADSSVPGSLPYDVNAEANVITALVCRADGGRPASVCHRPAIRHILKSVK